MQAAQTRQQDVPKPEVIIELLQKQYEVTVRTWKEEYKKLWEAYEKLGVAHKEPICREEYQKLWEAYEKLGAEYEQLRAAYEKGVSENKEGKKEFGSLASTVTNFFWGR